MFRLLRAPRRCLGANDTLFSRDGGADEARCGDGASDTVYADYPQDLLFNCENRL